MCSESPRCGSGYSFIGTWYGGIDLIECVFLSYGEVYILKDIGNDQLYIGTIEWLDDG